MLAPLPTQVKIPDGFQVMRSAEWCPWPLKCMVSKSPIRDEKIPSNCVCANHLLWYSVRN